MQDTMGRSGVARATLESARRAGLEMSAEHRSVAEVEKGQRTCERRIQVDYGGSMYRRGAIWTAAFEALGRREGGRTEEEGGGGRRQIGIGGDVGSPDSLFIKLPHSRRRQDTPCTNKADHKCKMYCANKRCSL